MIILLLLAATFGALSLLGVALSFVMQEYKEPISGSYLAIYVASCMALALVFAVAWLWVYSLVYSHAF